MSRKIEMVGKRFGRLVVLEEAGKDKNGCIRYKCKCDCGKSSTPLGASLRYGCSTSCGCGTGRTAVEMIGKRFGHIVIIKEAEKNKHGQKMWECHCDCGKYSTLCGSSLRSGSSTSCGCRTGKEFNQKEYMAAYLKANRKQLALKAAEYYKTHTARISAYRKANHKQIALKAAEYRKTHAVQVLAYRKAYGVANALYDSFIASISWAEKGRTRRNPSNPDELQVKCGLCQRWFNPTNMQVQSRVRAINSSGHGDSNFYCSNNCKQSCPVFKKSVHREGYAPNLSRPGQKEWRKHVIVCAEYTCERCGKVFEEKDLSAHHIKSVSQYPSESMDIDNGMALCKDCHALVHSEMGCRPIDLRCNAK